MAWSASPTAKTFEWPPPSSASTRYCGELVSWNSSTCMCDHIRWYLARASGTSRSSATLSVSMSSKSTTLRARSSASYRAKTRATIEPAPYCAAKLAASSIRFFAYEIALCTCDASAPSRSSVGTAAPFFGGARPSAASSCRTSLSASSASYTAKPRRYGSSGPRRSMSLRSIERQSEWKVPIVTWSEAAGPRSAVIRSRSSRAALFVKVSASTRDGGTRSVWIRWAIRAVSTRVLPEPGPAARRTVPFVRSTAYSCCWFIPRSRSSGESASATPASAAGSAAGAAPGKGGGRRAPRRFLRFSSFRSAVAGARASSSSRRWSRVFCAWHGLHSACRLVSPWPPPSASGTMWSTS